MYDGLPQQVQMRSVTTQKDLETLPSIMSAKRMKSWKVKGKRTLLSPLASQVRQRY
jgi:hypothetical protein